MARDLKQLLADNETVQTLQSALDELDLLKPTSPAWAEKIAAIRVDLVRELQIMDGQGSLF